MCEEIDRSMASRNPFQQLKHSGCLLILFVCPAQSCIESPPSIQPYSTITLASPVQSNTTDLNYHLYGNYGFNVRDTSISSLFHSIPRGKPVGKHHTVDYIRASHTSSMAGPSCTFPFEPISPSKNPSIPPYSHFLAPLCSYVC